MIDDDYVGPAGCLFGWAEGKGSFRHRLLALGIIAVLIGASYALFSWMGF